MKLGSYVMMLLVMMLVLEFVGIGSGLSSTLSTFGIEINDDHELTKADLGDSTLFQKLFADETGWLMVILGGGAIIIGFFAKGYDVSLIILPLITFTAVLFISTFASVISYAQTTSETWIIALITTIFVALAAGFIFSCVDYFAGR